MFIKICGIRTIEAALAAAEAGATAIGFVFAKSSRKIDPEAARDITKSLPPEIKKVGVFVNETKEKMEEIAQIVGLDYLQLHGDESRTFASSLAYPVIKAFSIDQLENSDHEAYPCDYILVDSPGTKYRGGSGNVFDWERLFRQNLDHTKLILAGGLNAENVGDAIVTVRPAGIDVSSGVETNGVKDIAKISHFIKEALQYKEQIK